MQRVLLLLLLIAREIRNPVAEHLTLSELEEEHADDPPEHWDDGIASLPIDDYSGKISYIDSMQIKVLVRLVHGQQLLRFRLEP